MKRILTILGLVILNTVPQGVSAGKIASAYALTIRGLTVGKVQLTGQDSASRYSVSGQIDSTGLARMIRQFSYRGTANGRVVQGGLQPDHYVESADTGRRASEAEIRYSGGVPEILRYVSAKEAGPDSPDPATQTGTVDPLTAIHALLRDVPRTRACDLDLFIFDGKRRSRISVAPAGTDADGLPMCSGAYERLQGFTAKEVSRHTRFDFTLTYSDAGNGRLAVREVAFDSFYGTAAIIRQ
ncbi:MAG: DUF3108 domain-containing protein [Rhodobacter sp.]|nr:DUF3108 domain-containing protein [Rhodobacter sp.]